MWLLPFLDPYGRKRIIINRGDLMLSLIIRTGPLYAAHTGIITDHSEDFPVFVRGEIKPVSATIITGITQENGRNHDENCGGRQWP